MTEKPLRATHGSPDRPLRIGNLEIPCYVLENGMRVLSRSRNARGFSARPTPWRSFERILGTKDLDSLY